MLSSAVRGFIERRVVSAPASAIAAWFLELSDGRVVFVVNDRACDTPGAEHYAESWFRLNALVRVRPFGVLLASELAQRAHLMNEYTHMPVD